MRTISNIRKMLAAKYEAGEFSGDTIEIIGDSFIADEPTIFGKVNEDYIKREFDWYLSESLNVNDITGKTPPIWTAHATPDGLINSNYGFLAFSPENGSQYLNAMMKLIRDDESRQATMIYTRPSMHSDWDRDGMSDFVCTNTVQYLIRDNTLHTIVQMRSNDVVFGYRNDYAWQKHIQEQMHLDLKSMEYPELKLGPMIWNAASLHVYERHYPLIEKFIETGEFDVSL